MLHAAIERRDIVSTVNTTIWDRRCSAAWTSVYATVEKAEHVVAAIEASIRLKIAMPQVTEAFEMMRKDIVAATQVNPGPGDLETVHLEWHPLGPMRRWTLRDQAAADLTRARWMNCVERMRRLEIEREIEDR